MTKTDNGWTARLELVPGRYEYKFIVDGKWISDPQNRQKVDDDFDGKNSVYFKTNRTFQIELPEKHREVILTGSFNNWNERQIKLHQIGNKWLVDVFLPIGTYGYKFIADGQWMTDPTNRDVRPDGAGNFNSFISIGDPYVFKLDGFPNAHQVILAGTFNEWSTVGLVMNKTAQGWELPFVLRPGYYQYKFIIDGNWMADKMQPITLTEDGQVNNFVVVHPNHVFNFYSAKATEVYVTGSFIDWREPGIPMHLEGNVWKTDAWLPQGKTTYKFLVDGQWILDPDNKLWEENEYGTGNSVLWIK
jgi:1,4-alpha-glucan branching enzyme